MTNESPSTENLIDPYTTQVCYERISVLSQFLEGGVWPSSVVSVLLYFNGKLWNGTQQLGVSHDLDISNSVPDQHKLPVLH